MTIIINTPSKTPAAPEAAPTAPALEPQQEGAKPAAKVKAREEPPGKSPRGLGRAEVRELRDGVEHKIPEGAPAIQVNALVNELQVLGAQQGSLPIAEFAALAELATRPVVEPAPLLTTELQVLEEAPASVFTTLDQDEWREVIDELSDKEPGTPKGNAPDERPWALLVHRAIAKLEDATVIRAIEQLPPAQQGLVARMTAAVRPVFMQQVAAPAFAAKRAAPVAAAEGKTRRAGAAERSLFATAEIAPVEVPAPALVAIEQVARELTWDGDVMELATIVMMECSKEAANDLKTLLKEMQETNKKRKSMREFITSEKKKRAAAEADLRKEYDRRVNLPEGDITRIDPQYLDFDGYKQSQQIVRYGTIDVGLDGVPTGDTHYGVSPNFQNYRQAPKEYIDAQGQPIAPEVVAVAQRLYITPENANQLWACWNLQGDLQSQFGQFERWLLAGKDNDGLGLAFPSEASQDAAVAQYLETHSPAKIAEGLCAKYNISKATYDRLYACWSTEQDASFRAAFGNKLETWLAAPPPSGPGLVVDSATAQDDKCSDAFFAGIAGFIDVQATLADPASAAIMAKYSLSGEHFIAIQSYFTNVGGTETVEEMIEQALAETSGDANAAVVAYLEKRSHTEFHEPYKSELEAYNSYDARRQAFNNATSFAEVGNRAQWLTGWIKGNLWDQAENRGNFIAKLPELLPHIEEMGNLLGPNRAQIQDLVKHVYLSCVQVGVCKAAGWHETGDAAAANTFREAEKRLDTDWQNLSNAINALPQPDRELANNFSSVMLALGAAQESFIGKHQSFGWNSYFDTGSAPGMIGYFNDQFTEDLVHQAHTNFEHYNADGSFAGMGMTFITNDAHKWASWHLCDRFLEGGGLWLAPTEVPVLAEDPGPEKPPAPTPDESVLQAAGEAARLGSGVYAFANDPQAVASAAQFTGDAAFEESVSRLAATDDQGIPQPPHVEVDGQELTLAQLDADIEVWQGRYDALGDLAQEQALRMQIYQQRYTKFLELLSNMMKATSDLSKNIIGNIKS